MAVILTLFYTSTHEIPTILYNSTRSEKGIPLISGGANQYSPL